LWRTHSCVPRSHSCERFPRHHSLMATPGLSCTVFAGVRTQHVKNVRHAGAVTSWVNIALADGLRGARTAPGIGRLSFIRESSGVPQYGPCQILRLVPSFLHTTDRGSSVRSPGKRGYQTQSLCDRRRYLLLAIWGRTIFAGSTMRLNSSSVTNPSFSAASFSVRSLSIA
jgi:hypothetical protein